MSKEEMSTCICGRCQTEAKDCWLPLHENGSRKVNNESAICQQHCAPGGCKSHGHSGHEHVHMPAQPVDEKLLEFSPARSFYLIKNMDCPMEEALIRKKLASVTGITDLKFNLMQRVLTVDHLPGPTDVIEDALRSINMDPEPLAKPSVEEAAIPETRIAWKKLALAGVLAAFSEIFELAGEWGLFGWDAHGWKLFDYHGLEVLALVLAIASILLGGLETFKKGLLAIVNMDLNINALMAVAVTGAVIIGQFPEAAAVMVLFNISEAIEAKAMYRVRKAIRDLLAIAPQTAEVLQPDGSWCDEDVKNVEPGSIVRVKPGERIALDGEVISGSSTVNQAPITGESIPADKNEGDPVFAGSINQTGSLEFRSTAGASDSTLARIIHAVEEAQASRAPMQRFVDVFARYYTPCVFLLALGWAVLMPLLADSSWSQSIYTGLVLLVIGCPCALVISTPITIVSAMAAASRRGILIKGGMYLELGRKLNCLALDKTGTLTEGLPHLVSFMPVGQLDAERVKVLATSLAARSDHPVSKAIAAAGGQKPDKVLPVREFEAIPGKGTSGLIDGLRWSLGNYSLVEKLGKASPGLKAKFLELEEQGNTVVALVGVDGVAGIFSVADTIRKSSQEAIEELNALNVFPIMLTGDNQQTAKKMAVEAGIKDFRANLLPDDKLRLIEELEIQGNVVGMVGDGINDAPALARANIGFAMAGGGTDTAIETADVALMDDDLRKIPRFIRLSRSTFTILVENISLALGIKAVFFALTLTGNATMWMAVFADVGAAMLVVVNGLRMLRK